MTDRYEMVGQLGDWTFWAWDGHPFEAHQGRTLYGFELVSDPGEPGKPKILEWTISLDRALLMAVCGKYTNGNVRGAAGSGVGTAADWVARMIGMDTLVPADYQSGKKALGEILVATAKHDGPIYRRADAMATELEKRGLALAVFQGEAR